MKYVTTAAAAAVALTGLLTLPGCQRPMTQVTWEMNGMPAHDHPYQTWWQYQFVYHPQAQVYYEPYTKTYFWYVGDQWEEGPVLPERITLDSAKAQIVKLQHQKPYTQHFAVMKWSWPYSSPRPGSLDEFHSTPEAIAASEHRAAMRAGADSRNVMGDDAPWEPVSGDIELMEPMSDANETPVDPFMGVDASSSMDEMPDAAQPVPPQTADAVAEAASPESGAEEDEFFTVVDPMMEGDPDD